MKKVYLCQHIMECKGKILIVDDNEDVLLSLNMLLRPWVDAIRVLRSPERMLEFINNFRPDVIILDMNFTKDASSGEEGYRWLARILEKYPKAVVLFITAYVSAEKAVRAIKAGALDFIPKPWDKDKVIDIVHGAVDLARYRQNEPDDVPERKPQVIDKSQYREFVGESEPILQLKRLIAKIAPTEANVLITGENGTGKDVVASEVHRLSLRRRGKLVSIDIGCIPENLFEAELFGYEKGAFTGATTSKPGRIEEAEGGTLFLDEIGNLSLMLQQKLLTVIEKRTFTRVGSNKERNVDVRVISATNANLKEMVKNGTFREDLYYRLNTIELQVPPLKERSNDIILLANYFLKKYIVKYNGEQQELSEEDNKKLLTYNWPGNVRELQHLMERRAIDAEYPLPTNETEVKEEMVLVEELPLNLEELERQAIMKAVRQSDGNLTQAALLLGISRFTLYRKLEKLGKQ